MELTELQEIINRHGKNLKQEVGLSLSEQEAKDIIKYAVSEVFSLQVVGSSLPNRNTMEKQLNTHSVSNAKGTLCKCNKAGLRGEKQCSYCVKQMENGEF